MSKQIAIGTIVGAVVIFLVSFAWHEFTPFAEIGLKNLPNEDALTVAMRLGIREPGWYMFPGIDVSKQNDPAEQKRFAEKFRQGPTGQLIYHPGGEEFSFGMLLAKQFCFGLLGSLVISWLLAMSASAMPGYVQRVLFVAGVALFGCLVTDLPYWNWYGFPGNYTAAHTAGQVLTWSVTALALAAIVKPRAA
jgi:hypothetical protein